MKKMPAYGFIIIISFLLLIPEGVLASTFPSYESLLDIDSLHRPTEITADIAGNIYIGELVNNRVSKYSSQGNLLETILLKSAPTALKASDDGLLYAGQEGKIEIYEGKTLINTIGGVSLPSAIDITTAGNIYVLDAGAYNVKVFGPSGNLLFTIGDYQVFGSDLRGLVLDEANGEFYVLDRGQPATGPNGETIYVWRVQVFDLNGNKLRSFSHYASATDGKLLSVSSIALDEQGRLFLSDNVQNVIGVYDYLGNYLGTMYDQNNSFYNIANLTYKNNRLYYVSFLEQTASVIGIDGYATLVVAPASISLDMQGSYVKGDKTITISNTGKGLLNWTATSGSSWLTLSSTSGGVEAGLQGFVDVVIDANGLSQGTHTGDITFESNGGAATVTVTVSVLSPPVLSVSPTEIVIQAKENEININLSDDLSGNLTWQTSSDSSWLSLSPSSGLSNTNTTANLEVDVSGLSAGTHTGNITVAASGATGSPATVVVILQIEPSGAIHVTTNLEAASFTITGPMPYTGSGTDWTTTDVSDGTYTITYGNVSGYKTPSSENKELSGGGTIEFHGEYLRVAKNIIASIESGNRVATEIRVFKAEGSMAAQFVPYPNVTGGAVTASGDINGDGEADIVAGYGLNTNNESVFSVFTKYGLPMTGKIKPFSTLGGIRLTVADLDLDGSAEVIAGAGNNENAPARVKIYTYNGSNLVETGIDFLAYSSNYGVEVAVGDVDGDGQIEILTLPNGKTPRIVRIWEVENTGGTWVVTLKGEFLASKALTGRITAGDLNADGRDEIIITSNDKVMVFNEDGTPYGLEIIENGGINIAAGDINGDGVAEIVLGLIGGKIKVYNSEGIQLNTFSAFNTRYQIRVSLGDLGY